MIFRYSTGFPPQRNVLYKPYAVGPPLSGRAPTRSFTPPYIPCSLLPSSSLRLPSRVCSLFVDVFFVFFYICFFLLRARFPRLFFRPLTRRGALSVRERCCAPVTSASAGCFRLFLNPHRSRAFSIPSCHRARSRKFNFVVNEIFGFLSQASEGEPASGTVSRICFT